MKHYTIREKQNGELAVRTLSEKAFNAYSNADIGVMEIETENGARYDVTGMIDGNGLTLEELEILLEELSEALAEE